MSESNSHIEGADELMKALDRMEKDVAYRIVGDSMKAGAREAVKTVKAAMPNKHFKKLVRYKFKKSSLMFATVGLFDKRKILKDVGYPDTPGNNKRLWSVAYWLNYGTLNRRDRSHKFSQPIRTKSKDRRNGVRPKRFYEPAEQAAVETFKKKMIQTFKAKTADLYE